ncbi:hypothetical protein Tco_0254936 [Tanacetum coccineum]
MVTIVTVAAETGKRHSLISQLFDGLKQLSNEVNDIRLERLARECKSVSHFLAAAQIHIRVLLQGTIDAQNRMHHHTMQSSPNDQVLYHTQSKGDRQTLLLIESVSEGRHDPKHSSRIRICKKLGTPCEAVLVVQKTGIHAFNCKDVDTMPGNAGKPKRLKTTRITNEKCDEVFKQAEQGVPLQAEQADWLEDTDEEIDEQELEAHYSYMAKI